MKIEITENDPRTSRTSRLGLGPRKHSKKTLLHLRQGKIKIQKTFLGGGGGDPGPYRSFSSFLLSEYDK